MQMPRLQQCKKSAPSWLLPLQTPRYAVAVYLVHTSSPQRAHMHARLVLFFPQERAAMAETRVEDLTEASNGARGEAEASAAAVEEARSLHAQVEQELHRVQSKLESVTAALESEKRATMAAEVQAR